MQKQKKNLLLFIMETKGWKDPWKAYWVVVGLEDEYRKVHNTVQTTEYEQGLDCVRQLWVMETRDAHKVWVIWTGIQIES